jgi:dephospho-CoA kinase
MASQADRADRLSRADFVLDNSGSVEELARRVDELWPRLVALGSDD